jgi:putative spermidine/putrescine transport system substrate-binding protein
MIVSPSSRNGCLHWRKAMQRHTATRWTRRTFLGASLTGAASLLALSVTPVAARQPITAQSANSGDMQSLIAAAKQEGQLTVIALPHDWLNYGQMIDSFKSKYGLQVNELNPDAGSGDEVEAIRANQGNLGPQAPDVIDVGYAFGPQAKQDGLLQPYQVSVWDTIPDSLKDPEGYWYGDYYGVMSFEVNTSIVKNPPRDWNDLLNSDYKGQVALAGDPRTSSQAINAVYAAALASGGSADNAGPGLDFFAKLNSAGNFVPVIAKQGTIAQGETPIVIRWDYLALGDRDSLKGNPNIQVSVPPSGILGGVYVQAISAFAPHPNAAKLWMEHLYSDEGQLIWLSGYGHPIRYNDLVNREAIPADLAAKLPPADIYAQALFASNDQLNFAKAVITSNWDKTVNVNVQ